MTDLRDKIAAVLADHIGAESEKCGCTPSEVADAVIDVFKSTRSSEYHKGYLDGFDEGFFQGWEAASGR